MTVMLIHDLACSLFTLLCGLMSLHHASDVVCLEKSSLLLSLDNSEFYVSLFSNVLLPDLACLLKC